MSEIRERSGLFKFLYIILRVITFPIYAVLFVLKHPLWVLFILLMAGGAVVYYPMSKGVELDNVWSWYLDKYQTVKVQAVSKAIDSGVTDFVPEKLSLEVKRLKKEHDEEIEEAKLPKSENYNKKVVRDKKIEETKMELKKRGGFKRKTNESEKVLKEDDEATLLLKENEVKAGGLAGILKKENKQEEVTEQVKEATEKEDESEAVETKPDEPEAQQEVPMVEPENVLEEVKKENQSDGGDSVELDLF